MKQAGNIPLIPYPIKDCMRQYCRVRINGENLLKTTSTIWKMIQTRDPIGYGNCGKIK